MHGSGLVLEFADRVVDLGARSVTSAGETVSLTELEALLLAFLARQPEHQATRDELLAAVWGWRSGLATRTVDHTVYRLRRKLEPDPGSPVYLTSLYGRGYQLVGVAVRSDEVDIGCVALPTLGPDGALGGFQQWAGAGPVIVGRSRSFDGLLASAKRKERLRSRLAAIRDAFGGGRPVVANLAFFPGLSRVSAAADVVEGRLRVLAFSTPAMPITWCPLDGERREALPEEVVVTDRAIELSFGPPSTPYAQVFLFASRSALDDLGGLAVRRAKPITAASTQQDPP